MPRTRGARDAEQNLTQAEIDTFLRLLGPMPTDLDLAEAWAARKARFMMLTRNSRDAKEVAKDILKKNPGGSGNGRDPLAARMQRERQS